jgi:hypothetical protein
MTSNASGTEGLRRHAALLVLIMVTVALVYAKVTRAAFCGYDDFNEAYRAAFFDGKDPMRIFTAPHYSAFMYRPVTSALQLGTWQFFGHNPIAFRIRNLAMHLVAVAMVYGIAFLLGRSRLAAAAAALLFGVNPLANQAVVVAIWTNTTAYALLLASFFAFLLALRQLDDGRRWTVALVSSFGLAFVAIFTYEPTIAVFAMMAVYLGLCHKRPLSRSFSQVLGAGAIFDLAIFFGARHALHITSATLLPVREIARSFALYVVALILPVDPVLGNALFGVPLPGWETGIHKASFIAPAVYLVILIVVFVIGLPRPLAGRLADAPWRTLLFAFISVLLTLAPIALYREHASEFNLYVPEAIYAIALAIAVKHFSRGRIAFDAVLGLLLASYLAGSFVRNERVIACARIATKIVASLPTSAWKTGGWHIRLATPPDRTLTPRYGIYNYSGIDTIEIGTGNIRGAQEDLRLATGNDEIFVDVVPGFDLRSGCTAVHTCFYVYPDGNVSEVRKSR